MTPGQEEIEASRPPALAGHAIFVRYVVFAVIAGVANLATQEAAVRLLPPDAPIMLSVLAGTAVGFVVKYLLDKYWIFLDGYDGHIAELRKVALYGVFSVGTTLLFWGVELGFWHIWRTAEAKYAGAVLGLALGNWLKYRLDRAFVFRRMRP
jgi:putative flippase GtrA